MSFAVLLLAAGQGKRMKSRKPKVLHKALGMTLLEHVLAALPSGAGPVYCVVSPANREAVSAVLPKGVRPCVQKQQRGTADAVKAALPELLDSKTTSVMIVPGDMPLLGRETLSKLARIHRRKKHDLTVLSVELDDPRGYGRIIRDDRGRVTCITEDVDLAASQRAIREINTSVYMVETAFLGRHLPRIGTGNAQKEFYLTDLVALAHSTGAALGVEKMKDPAEGWGINSRRDLARAIALLRLRKLEALMAAGVTIEDPDSTFIDQRVKVGRDTVIHPFTVITGVTRIGRDCEVGPFTHLHDEVILADGACVGNFVEIKKSRLGAGSKAKHLTYLGDAQLGKKVNIGAGTITANYDGRHKHLTRIRDGVHVGSNSVIVAPNDIGAKAVIGAGTVLTAKCKVPGGALVYGVPGRLRKRT